MLAKWGRQLNKRKLQASNPHEHWCKNPQKEKKILNKILANHSSHSKSSNIFMYYIYVKYALQTNGVYSSDVRFGQYLEIHEDNPL